MSRMCHGQFVGIISSVDSLAVAAEKNETTFTYYLYQVHQFSSLVRGLLLMSRVMCVKCGSR